VNHGRSRTRDGIEHPRRAEHPRRTGSARRVGAVTPGHSAFVAEPDPPTVGAGPLWRGAVFLAGLLCILTGVVLTALPGPLTIPPILLGLHVWFTEFTWARRLFGVFRTKARQAWKHARRHPLRAGAFTLGGLLLAALAMWSVGHFHLVAWVGAPFTS
jgi:hypothetical protein